ncbi:proteasome accessory factor PafA2 [Tersicoccus solisilvae]|uniref:Proteasome accessory factor PafA2 n=1 Tax=Tersicoccus solisilvae TaxID=1882339 RepID=A0ABQ1NV59_9MICC|nr:depupylase/deamidase Dop [Tersicoccus solisilvae]GGC83696.1 proteasome accessory factor PafA2 [Tersicoccus solisilvae]
MTVHRIMGSETEFGVLAPSAPGADSTVLATRVINAWADLTGLYTRANSSAGGAGWDYSDEAPLADARGWVLARGAADPSQLTDEPDVLTAEQVAAEGLDDAADDGTDPITDGILMNVVLGNGARLYVDHAHPEYAGPEVTNPLDAVRWDAAGDAVARAAMDRITATGGTPIQLYKNNTDGKAASYGSHENYLMPREVPFGAIVAGLVPFFVSRQVICGAGRVGIGVDGSTPGFQLSQRADFFEAEVGLETTVRRPIINTRDEPHAVAERFRRLHVIIGDANLAEISGYLKFGTTALVLSMIEAGTAPTVQVVDPVAALQTISHDPTLRATVRLADGRAVTGLDLQRIYLDAARAHCARTGADDPATDPMTADVLARWTELTDLLAADPAAAADQLDWAAKLALVSAYRDRDRLAWDDPRLALVDLQYSDVRTGRGLYHRLVAGGRLRRLLDDEDVAAAVTDPPEDTRAWFRGQCLQRFAGNVAAANWDSVVFDLPGARRLVRIPTKEPHRGTRDLTASLFADSIDAADFVRRLGTGPEPGGVAR